MVDEILKFTKITFLIHIILGSIFTILYWIPEISAPIFGLPYLIEAGAVSMVLGAAAAGLVASSIFGYFAKEWKEVKIVVINELVWLGACLIALIINIGVFGLNVIMSFIFVSLMFVLFVLSYLQQEEIIGELFQGK